MYASLFSACESSDSEFYFSPEILDKITEHCVQGAIDMVQMDLEERDPEQDLLRLKAYCRKFRPPKQIGAETKLLLKNSTDLLAADTRVHEPGGCTSIDTAIRYYWTS